MDKTIKHIRKQTLTNKLAIIAMIVLFGFLGIKNVDAHSHSDVVFSSNNFTKNLLNTSLLSMEEDVNLIEYFSNDNNYVYEFDYTGDIQYFTAPLAGDYKLDLWGAQGGHRVLETRGGRGGYSTGVITLAKGERIAIYVGGKGNAPSNGFNGGGRSQISGIYGGGATDIRVGNYGLYERVIVAGGGGSVGAADKPGAAGGGLVGRSAIENFGSGGAGGSQTAGGTSRGAFGQGGSGSFPHASVRVGSGGGGGGGWFGGGGAVSDMQGLDDDRGGGGGSGYVLTESSHKPTNYLVPPKYYLKETNMFDGTSGIPSKEDMNTSSIGNPDNGYAIITKLNLSDNSYLSDIDIRNNYQLQPTFDKEINNYIVDLPVDVTEVEVKGIAEDPLSIVRMKGPGIDIDDVSDNTTFEVPAPGINIEIIVTAQNGTSRVYKISFKRSPSHNGYPNALVITGLVPSLCSAKDEYCKVNPTFDIQNTLESGGGFYHLIVPARIKQLEFSIIKGHEYQKVEGTGVLDLEPGPDNSVYIRVESESGAASASYIFDVTRDMEGNAELEELELVVPRRDLKFDPDRVEYFTSIPFDYDHTDKLEFKYKTLDPNASVEVLNEGPLDLGTNIIEFLVTAENGNTKRYLVYVYREENGNSFLESLKVSDDKQEYDLTPTFNKMKFDYHLIVENDVKNIDIEAIPEIDSTLVSMDSSNVDLKVGQNVIQVTSTARTGAVSLYNIVVVRKASDNNNIKNIKVNGEYLEGFVPSLTKQKFKIGSEVVKPVFEVELEDPTAKYSFGGDYKKFVVGDNELYIRVAAEDRSVKTYLLTFTREVSDDSSLIELYSPDMDLMTNFNPLTLEYDYEIDYTEDPIYIMGTANHLAAKVEGNGSYYLAEGENEIDINVIAEDNSYSQYKLNINMKERTPNENPYLKSISLSSGELFPIFGSEKMDYTIYVPYEVEEIDISGIPIEDTTSVEGTGVHELEIGDNNIDLVTEAENGKGVTYRLNVIRDVSKNADLKYIYVHEGALNRKYFPEVTNYDVRIPYGVKKVTIETETVDKNASYEILGNENLVSGMNTITIRVTPDNNGDIKEYVLNVFVQGPSQFDLDLITLEVDEGTLVPDFRSDKQFYRVDVDNEIRSIGVKATSRDSRVSITGIGKYNLEVGENIIVVTTESNEGIIKDYQIVVNRKKSTDASLSSMSLGNLVGPPHGQRYRFYPGTVDYKVTSMNTYLIINAVTTHPKATFEIIGNHDFNEENITNEVIVRVTAEDGITTQDYTITVTKIPHIPSKNARLSSLSISGVQYEPRFSPGSRGYVAEVPKELQQVKVAATAQEPNATLEYKVINKLEMGDNYIQVKVTAEDNIHKEVYQVLVKRLGSVNNNLTSLSVDDVPFADFASDKYYYDLPDVQYEKDTIKVDYELEDDTATVTGAGEVKLKEGDNLIPINVTSENGDVKTYYIRVKRLAINSALLKDLYVDQYPFDGGFDSEVFDYNLIIDNEVNELYLRSLVTLDPKARVEVTGNENLKVGLNRVYIQVTSSRFDKTETYTLNVTKQSYGDNLLSYLKVVAGNQELALEPVFKDGVMVYMAELSDEFDSVIVDAKAKSTQAEVGNLGEHQVDFGVTQIKVPVKSAEGPVRTYHVFIEKSKSHDNLLTSLNVEINREYLKFSPAFDPLVNEYTLDEDLNVGIESLILNATANTKNMVGNGVREIVVGKNELIITVTSESGIKNEYIINYNRKASSEVNLRQLTPSAGELLPNFDESIDEYDLEVPTTAPFLKFNAVTKDKNATVTGVDERVVKSGKSVRVITVTAENGIDTKEYTVNINKNDDRDTALTSLNVRNYMLAPDFESDIYTYRITIPHNVDVIWGSDITYTTSDKDAYVTVPYRAGIARHGETVIPVVVTAGDGISKETYRIVVTRERSAEARISELVLRESQLSPSFNGNVFEYDILVPKELDSFKRSEIRRFKLVDPFATVTYSHDIDEEILVPESGTARFTIKVTSENGQVTNEYVFNIGRYISPDNYLANIIVEDGRLKPGFSAGRQEYDVDVLEDATYVVVRAYPRHPLAKVISITGGDEFDDEDKAYVEIVVQAEDMSLRTYTLNISKTLSVSYDLEGLELNNAKGQKLKPTYSPEVDVYRAKVDRDVTNAGLVVTKGHPSQGIQLKDFAGKPVNINNLPLSVGLNYFTLEVTNGLGDTREIEVIIEKEIDDNNSIRNLVLENDDKDKSIFEFDENITYYNQIEIPYDETELRMAIELESIYSTYEIYNNTNLKSGNNQVTVRVTAESGDTKDYVLRVFKDYEVNNLLQTITVSDGKIISDDPEFYSPSFHKGIYDYTARISNNTNKVSLEAVVDEEGTHVTVVPGPNVIVLEEQTATEFGIFIQPNVGNNRIDFITEKDGQTKTYTVNLVREAIKDVKIMSLEMFDINPPGLKQKLDQKFDPDKFSYTMQVGPRVNGLLVSVTPDDKNATVEVEGNKALYTGENLVKITVISEDRLHINVYFIRVFKSMSDDNDLNEMHLIPEKRDEDNNIVAMGRYDFDKPIKEESSYTVDSDITTVTIGGNLSDPYANIVGLGRYSLNYGDNIIEISITAQNGDVKVYKVNVFRKFEYRLESLRSSVGVIEDENSPNGFSPDVFSYVIKVPLNVSTINLTAIAMNAPIAVVSGDGFHDLDIGDNIIRITVTTPTDTSGQLPYVTTIKVIRSDSINADLEILDIDEGMLTPEFDKTIFEYSTDIRDTHNEITLTIKPEDPKATFEIIDVDAVDIIYPYDENKTDGTDPNTRVKIKNVIGKDYNKITIRVTAANGYTQDTVLTINRQPAALFNNLLSSLTVTPSQRLVPTFRPTINNYVAIVAPDVTEVDIKATTQIPESTIISGTGLQEVVPGKANIYNIVVRSKDGIDNIYKVTIHQVPSSDPYLKELEFEEGHLSPVFTPLGMEYRMNVPANTSSLTERYVVNRAGTKVDITGAGYTEPIVSGDQNLVIIKTTAGNMINTAEYRIRVNMTNQTSVYLRDIEVTLVQFEEEFNKTNEGPYTLKLDANDNSVLITPKPEDPDAIDYITVDGVRMFGSAHLLDMTTLNNKLVQIVVHGKSGNEMNYFINVEKELHDAVKLTNLGVNPGTLDPIFDPNHTMYDVEVDAEHDRIEIFGSWSGNVTVDGLGMHELQPGLNTFTVTLTTDLGDVGVYTINVTRKVEHSAKILELMFNQALIEIPPFNKDVLEYSLRVPYEVDELSIYHILLEDEANSTYTMTHTPTNKLTVGSNNIVKITVENDISGDELVYEFRVTRYPFTSNFLLNLTTDQGDLTPTFDKYVNNYDIDVPYEVEEITLIGSPEDGLSSVTGIGVHKDLEVGINELKVIVTKDNVPRVYIVRVNRLEDTNNDLINLEVVNGVMNIPFDSSILEYDVEVPEEFGKIEFIGEIPGRATVVGLDNMTATADGTLKGKREINITQPSFVHEITVTAADGVTVKTYKFNITKLLSSEVIVEDLIPTIDGKPVIDQAYKLNPEFDDLNADQEYEMIVPDHTSFLGFDVKTSPLNTVSGNDQKQLNYGDNEFVISVTSEDGTTTREYKVNVIRVKEIQDIKINPDTLAMNVNQVIDLFDSEDIEVEITPDDASKADLKWESDDEDVVSVDENGVLTANKPGNVVIKVSSISNPNISATLNVEVLLLQLDSDLLDISRLNPDDESAGLKEDVLGIENYVVGSKDFTTIEDFKKMFNNEYSTLKVLDENASIIDDSEFIGTKMIIRLEVNNVIYDEARVIVRGDLSGDGYILINDLLEIDSIIAGIVRSDEIIDIAGDFDRDSYILINDYLSLDSYIAGIIDDLNSINEEE